MTQGDNSDAKRVLWFRRLTGTFFLLLVASTWPLWIPRGTLPQVPAFGWLAELPIAVDWVCLAVVILACVVWTVSGRFVGRGAAIFLVSLALLLLLDQLRWQPWALQVWLSVAVIALAKPPQALRLLRWLTIGIYFHSAIAKLDHEFAHTMGQQFLGTLLGGMGLEAVAIPAHLRLWLSMGFPIAELLVAALLCFRRTVRIGVVAAVAMHLFTIAILGPWGLGHQMGVLIWNLSLAIQAPIVFWPRKESATFVTTERSCRRVAAMIIVLLAVLLPFGTRFGWWDTWPSWGLYAPGAGRATIWLHEFSIVRLPPEMRPYVQGNQMWKKLRLDRWVLSELHAPLYPQPRVELAVAKSIADRFQVGDLIRVEMATPADRWTGERDVITLDNREAINDAAVKYWLNALETRWSANRE